MAEETRRCAVQEYAKANPGKPWVAHPMGVNEPEVKVTAEELAHGLPCCEGTAPPVVPPKTIKMWVSTDTLNVRDAASLDGKIVSQLKRNDEVIVEDGAGEWARLVSPFGGRYVYRGLLRPT